MLHSLLALVLVFTAGSLLAQQQAVPIVPGLAQPAAKEKEPTKDDTKILSDAKLSADDPPGLIAYFKKRTLSNDELAKIRAIIRRMGDESFEERMKASEEAVKFGLGAIGPLRAAATSDPDAEIQYRAFETLRMIEKVPQNAVASAAARMLARSKHPEAASALLNYVPMVDNVAVEEDICQALKVLAIRDGKLEPALTAGLNDDNPVRRAIAAVALIGASIEGKTLQDEVARLVTPMLKGESDGNAKFRIAFELATVAKNPDAVMALAEVLPSLPRGRLWQVEDFLLQLAGDSPPKIKLPQEKSALEKSSAEWLAWLKTHRKPEDYAKLNYKARTSGRIIMLLVDQNWGSGKITELSADLRPRWKIPGIYSPADFRMLPNGNIEIMEHQYSRITERDLRNNIKSTQQLPGGPPMSCQKLENGNMLVAYRQSVVEYDAKWKALNTWNRNNQDCMAAGRFGSGPTVALVQNPPSLIRLDEKFKELPNPVKVGPLHWQQPKIEMLPNNRVLVTEQQQVVEYDLTSGKSIWKFQGSNPTCVQRLPSGSTLIADMGNRSIKEVHADGEVLWSYSPPDNLMPQRAYRQ